MENKEFISLAEAAKILGISRIAVYKKVKSGKIQAIKIGRSFAISKEYFNNNLINITGSPLKEKEKRGIEKAVRKTVEEYGETLKRLGKE